MRDCVPDKGYSMNRLHKTSAVAAIAAVTISLLTALISTHATAQQKFPAKPIRIIVAFTAGGTPDTLARVIGQKMSEHWGQPVIIENRPGASGAIAAHLVAKATPDGYTLLATSASIAINVAMQIKQPYDTLKDLSGVANIGYSTDALVVAPALGIKSLRDFIAHGRAHPGKLLFGSSGTGTSVHLANEKLISEAGIKAVHVPFKGLPEFLIDISAGRIHFGVAVLGAARSLINDGKLVLLAVGPSRSPLYPDVPAIAETVPGYQANIWNGLIAPGATPRAIINRLNQVVVQQLKLPEVRERYTAIGAEVLTSTPQEFDAFIRSEMVKWEKVIQASGMRAN